MKNDNPTKYEQEEQTGEFTEEDFDAALYKATRKIDIEGEEDDPETDRDD